MRLRQRLRHQRFGLSQKAEVGVGYNDKGSKYCEYAVRDAYGSQQNFRNGITLKKEELLEFLSSNKGRATPCWINLKKKLQHEWYVPRVKKCDLSKLAYELGKVVPPESRIVDLKRLILNSQSYEENSQSNCWRI
ncbi:hypothetical protein LAZ67_12001903 [Cordylochernes scorpioides]|uniref:LAGLIDADG homing endonuclease n=1 Tax=Cordylochernes scorpioides TaxID=51811 RepID=A0ABY6L5D0_9ARAC|nr:hypothetical protein LAZ67_12001903 [Cordylochernes scorpioides]